MFWNLFGEVVDKLGFIGAWGSVGAIVIMLLQYAFKKETKAAWKDLVSSFGNLVKNVPRRWKSEVVRLADVKAALLATENSGDDDIAAVKAFATKLYASVRVISGIIEDSLNILVKVFVLIAPPLIALYRRFILKKAK